MCLRKAASARQVPDVSEGDSGFCLYLETDLELNSAQVYIIKKRHVRGRYDKLEKIWHALSSHAVWQDSIVFDKQHKVLPNRLLEE